jgi:glycosyltransferase involved in cell wall biosynthesis
MANGIDTSRYSSVRPRQRGPDEPMRIGFVGRVAPIKDIKTMLSALAILKARGIAFEAMVIGSMDQEPEYAKTCQAMSARLGLSDQVRFLGHQNPLDYFEKLDVVLLTSVSEGQPFVILEANCAGLPVVATDVGACREMLQGRSAEDRALGVSGLITPVASPPATASALERIARSPALGRQMGEAGRRRVRQNYEISNVVGWYAKLYERLLAENKGRA